MQVMWQLSVAFLSCWKILTVSWGIGWNETRSEREASQRDERQSVWSPFRVLCSICSPILVSFTPYFYILLLPLPTKLHLLHISSENFSISQRKTYKQIPALLLLEFFPPHQFVAQHNLCRSDPQQSILCRQYVIDRRRILSNVNG